MIDGRRRSVNIGSRFSRNGVAGVGLRVGVVSVGLVRRWWRWRRRRQERWWRRRRRKIDARTGRATAAVGSFRHSRPVLEMFLRHEATRHFVVLGSFGSRVSGRKKQNERHTQTGELFCFLADSFVPFLFKFPIKVCFFFFSFFTGKNVMTGGGGSRWVFSSRLQKD